MNSTVEPTEAKSLILLYPAASSENEFLQRTKTLLQAEAKLQIQQVSSVKEISEGIKQFAFALLIFSVQSKEDLTQVMNALQELQALIKGKLLRVIGVNSLEHPQIPAILMKRGCADLFSPTLNPKAVKHKISQALRILDTYRAQGIHPPAEHAKPGAQTPAQSEQNPSGIKKTPALTLASDCWLVRKEKDVRRIQGRWLVDLIGPGPSSGMWDDAPNQPKIWQWKPKDNPETKDFITDEGHWTFRGRRPEFVWDIGRWRFLGDSPELAFIHEEKTLAWRFKLVGIQMELSENSQQAKAKLPAIVKSIENEVRFRNEEKAKAGAKEVKDETAPASKKLNWDGEGDDDDEAGESGLQLDKLEQSPYTQAPSPQLKIWLQRTGDAEGSDLVEASPVELSDHHLLLEVPLGSFKRDENLILFTDDGLMRANSKTQVQTSIKEILASENVTDTVSILIDPEMRLSLTPIQRAFEDRQAEILDFLKAARGW